MKHPNKKIENSNKWWCKFLQSVDKARRQMVEDYVDQLEARKRIGGKTVSVELADL